MEECIIATQVNVKGYSVYWRDIVRPDILKRDKYRCTHCSISNHTKFYNENRRRIIVDDAWLLKKVTDMGIKVSKVYLSISHSCNNSNCVNYQHLTSLCQACHLRFDSHLHVMNRLINAAKKK